MRHLVEVADLTDTDIAAIKDFARRARAGSLRIEPSLLVALLFRAPSTRTRLGFAAAAVRLGGQAFEINENRETGPGLPSETLDDTIRVCGGMSDAVVLRASDAVDWSLLRQTAVSPLVNAGDADSHPTQALLDCFAIEELVGPIPELHIAISGDLTMRSSRSLIQLLAKAPPARLSLFSPHGRGPAGADLAGELSAVTDVGFAADFSGADVVYLPGLTPGSGPSVLDQEQRDRWGFTPTTSPSVGADAAVLSPGPVIDEIHPSCRADPRVRVFEQSDLGVYVRMGVLQWLMERPRVQ